MRILGILEGRTLWGTLKFRKYFFRHIMGDGVRRATKGITNVKMVFKVTGTKMRSYKVIVVTVLSEFLVVTA